MRENVGDSLANATEARLHQWLGIYPRSLRTRKVFHVEGEFSPNELNQILEALTDPVVEVSRVGMLEDYESDSLIRKARQADAVELFAVRVAFLPGVTDTLGKSVKQAIEDCLDRKISGQVYSSRLYLFEGLQHKEVERVAEEVLYNPLIQSVSIASCPRELDLSVPLVGEPTTVKTQTIPVVGASDTELIRIAQEGMLALNLAEMQAIAKYFAELGRQPKDVELECLAQTWSEHCKHKIFASPIDYVDEDGNAVRIKEGLFRRYIKGSTESIAKNRIASKIEDCDSPFLVSVFHDNAGVVRFTERDHLVYKVETHNSPSALDPYGGAMTGIVGVNRDSFGTGLGADLLTNVWGYCLGNVDYDGDLPGGLMHPRRIRDGVHAGVTDGGNHSGIPYSRGFELFDDRYVGKPLVFCGTIARMPVEVAGRASHRKYIKVGDKIVMVGGRIGKDGIHGATFSSLRLDDRSPVQAVQIGDPIVQRMMWDMLSEARDRGLYSGLTDNGAGGLSSSVGELAQITNGAKIDLARAPLKYAGLAPWEILISEAQERMTVAVPPEFEKEFLQLAKAREVEATVIGEFTQTGRFEVSFEDQLVCDLDLEFLHEGVPLLPLHAQWNPPDLRSHASQDKMLPNEPMCGVSDSIEGIILRLLTQPNLSSQEDRARSYDHEVKGLSVIKPWIGVHNDVPATATVMRARHHRNEGIVLGEGIFPFYGEMDPNAMARASVDEGLRKVLCAGARLDRVCALDNFCWPDPIFSEQTPDGPHKLAQLLRCCQGLAEACVAYGVPLISGKDSMKNDAYFEGRKISIPPTLLVSVLGQMEDVDRALTLEPRAEGDCILLMGATLAELAGSELERLYGTEAMCSKPRVPQVDLEANLRNYQAFERARDEGLVRSAHVVSRGGVAIALSHLALASELGIKVDLDLIQLENQQRSRISAIEAAFSESTGRILMTCQSQHLEQLYEYFADGCLIQIGQVISARESGGWLTLTFDGGDSISVGTDMLRKQFRGGLYGQ